MFEKVLYEKGHWNDKEGWNGRKIVENFDFYKNTKYLINVNKSYVRRRNPHVCTPWICKIFLKSTIQYKHTVLILTLFHFLCM
jgi:hypothetical protein